MNSAKPAIILEGVVDRANTLSVGRTVNVLPDQKPRTSRNLCHASQGGCWSLTQHLGDEEDDDCSEDAAPGQQINQ